MLALGVIFIGGSFVGVTGLPPRPGMYYLYGKQSIQQANIVKDILYISIDRLYTIFISDFCKTHADCKKIGESCFMDICATMGKSYICRYEEMLI